MAKKLRDALAIEGRDISHAKALEFIAKSLGFSDWNTATATLTNGAPKNIEFTECSPILRFFDVVKAREFYCDFLGFSVVFEHQHTEDLPLYMAVQRDGL